MTIQEFVVGVISELRIVASTTPQPVMQGYVAGWRIGDVAVDFHRADNDVVLVRLVAPGVSTAPVEHPVTLRGVRDVANIIAAAFDIPSDLDPAE